jgi:hypothetical protein
MRVVGLLLGINLSIMAIRVTYLIVIKVERFRVQGSGLRMPTTRIYQVSSTACFFTHWVFTTAAQSTASNE